MKPIVKTVSLIALNISIYATLAYVAPWMIIPYRIGLVAISLYQAKLNYQRRLTT